MSERHFTTAVFVVHQGRVLLLFHRALGRWLPPGGHLIPGELPDEGAAREVLEETGIPIRFAAGPAAVAPGGPRLLARPAGIQLETIEPGHEHIDLIYFAAPAGETMEPHRNEESLAIGWYGPDDWESLGVDGEIQAWSRLALAHAGAVTDWP